MQKHLQLSVILLLSVLTTQLSAQCGRQTCPSAVLLCDLSVLDSLDCFTNDKVNTQFPLPNLCIGTGVPTNLTWWAFVGDGEDLELRMQTDLLSCESGNGISAGIFEGNCDGTKVFDCESRCGLDSIVLSGKTKKCEIYYLWINGCDGDYCGFEFDLVKGGGTPQLSTPMPDLNQIGDAWPCRSVQVCFPGYADGCDARLMWTVNGIPRGRDEQCITVDIPTDAEPADLIPVCLTVGIGGNPGNPNIFCDTDYVCVNIIPKKAIKHTAPLCEIPFDQQPYTWQGMLITTSCVNPPCTARVQLASGLCVDSIKPIRLLPPIDGVLLKGYVYQDEDNDCKEDIGDLGLKDYCISIESKDTAIQIKTDRNGYYGVLLTKGNYTIKASETTGLDTICPDSITVTADSTGTTYCSNFYVKTPGKVCAPLTVDIKPLKGRQRWRCDGINRTISVSVRNLSGRDHSGDSVLVCIDSLAELLEADRPFTLLSNKEMRVYVGKLAFGARLEFNITAVSDCDAKDLGKTLCVRIKGSNDGTCKGQVKGQSEYCEVLRDSYDPNDLILMPFGELTPRYIEHGTEVTGRIRFHNTGTDTAYDIGIDLVLSEDFEAKTLMLSQSSAEQVVMSTDPTDLRKVRFQMTDVRLPHDQIDMINSHGWIDYKVQLSKQIPLWTKVEQQAFIYFDKNPAVLTQSPFHTIAPPYVNANTTVEVCEGDEFKGIVWDKDGFIIDTLVVLGPDTITNTQVSVLPSYEILAFHDVFQDEEFQGVYYTQDTVVTEPFQSIDGCDSLIHHNLNVSYRQYIDLDACEGDIILGDKVVQSDTTISIFINNPQMDTLSIYNIIVHPNFTIDVDTSLSKGEEYLGRKITQDTIITELLIASTGCDSVVTHTISVISTGINDQTIKLWNIYPNPSEDGWINIQGKLSPDLNMDVYDSNAGKVQTIKQLGNGKVYLDLQPGMYYLVIKRNGTLEQIEKVLIF